MLKFVSVWNCLPESEKDAYSGKESTTWLSSLRNDGLLASLLNPLQILEKDVNNKRTSLPNPEEEWVSHTDEG